MSTTIPAEWALDTRLIGRRILCFDRVESTNTLAASYSVDPANDGLAILADEQTAGRGRQGRTWLCTPGDGVLMSVLLFPPDTLRRPVILTILAAVAVCETIYDCTRLQTTIKWPNDVLVRGRKVSGILVEQGRATVIGIGLNVQTPAEVFEVAGLGQAGSLRMFTEQGLDRRAIAETLIRLLDRGYDELRSGQRADLESRWRWHSGLLGKHVTARVQGIDYRGRLVEIGFDGLALEDTNGTLRRINPEAIEELSPA